MEKIQKDPYKYGYELSIKDLVKILQHFADTYYNTGKSLVSDEIYDLLCDILRERDPSNKFLLKVGAPVAKKKKVKLPYFMSSLEKIKPDTEAIEKWKLKYTGSYFVSDKMDGVSCLFIKKDGITLYKHGDGYEGETITHLLPYIFKDFDFESLPEIVAVRGELIISKKNFEAFAKTFKNARVY